MNDFVLGEVEELKALVNNGVEMNEEQLGLIFNKVNQVLDHLSITRADELLADSAKATLFADIIAVLRNLVGLAIDNKSNALIILANLAGPKKSLFSHLAQIYIGYGEHLCKQLTPGECPVTIEEVVLVSILRLTQLFYNILNLHFSFEDALTNIELEKNLFPLFDQLRYIV